MAFLITTLVDHYKRVCEYLLSERVEVVFTKQICFLNKSVIHYVLSVLIQMRRCSS